MKVIVALTAFEAEMLQLAASAGTVDDAIDHLGWSARDKSAFRRAYTKLRAEEPPRDHTGAGGPYFRVTSNTHAASVWSVSMW